MAVSNLSPWQSFLSSKFKGKSAPTDAQLRAAADEFFGPIPIPPGSQIIYQDGGRAEWIDPQGYKHSATRQLDGRDPNAGQLRTNTNRPAGAPVDPAAAEALNKQQAAQNDLLAQLMELAKAQSGNAQAMANGQTPAGLDPGIRQYLDQVNALAGQLAGPAQFQTLDPTTAALLDQISAAERAKLDQQFQDAQGTAIARLYGNRVNQSTLGNEAIARLTQAQGLVSQQQMSDAAQRQLALQQYLTGQTTQNRQLAMQGLLGAADAQLGGFRASNDVSQNQTNALNDLLKAFTGYQTQRDLLGATIEQQNKELAETNRQSNLNFELAQQKADMELAASRNAFLKQLGGSILGAGLSALSGGFSPGGFFNKAPSGGSANVPA